MVLWNGQEFCRPTWPMPRGSHGQIGHSLQYYLLGLE